MKKIMLTATALIFTVAMFAQTTGSAPATAKSASKKELVQNTQKSTEQKNEMKGEKKKKCSGKGCHHKVKETSKT